MKKLLAALVLGAALLAAPVAEAQSRCISHDGAVKQLAKKYGESVRGRGLTKGNKSMMELFVSKKGTWTLVVTNTKGASCVVAAGENWFDVPAVPLPKGEPS